MSITEAESYLEQTNVKLLRVNFLDNANMRRAKVVPQNRFSDVFVDGVGLTEGSLAFPLQFDCVVPDAGLSVTKDVYMVPAPETVKVVPWNKKQAMSIADVVTVDDDGHVVPWEHCHRSLLKKLVAETKESTGIDVNVGIENEFVLLKEDGTPSDRTSYAQPLALEENAGFIDDIVETLEELGIPLWLLHPEGCNGQIEICLNYTDPVTLADNQYYFKESVVAIAHKHHLNAIFLPKVLPNQPGNGMHCHFSINRDGKNLFRNAENPFQLEGEAASFVAGILEHLPAIMAISASNACSYTRLLENYWAGVYAIWGYDNKEAPLRISRSLTGLNTVEYKTPDQFSNIYLLLSAIIVCGIDGVKRGAILPEPCQVNPALLDDETKQERGIQRLPKSLEESLEAFENDELLTTFLGEARVKAYLAVKRYELEFFNKIETVEEVVQILLHKQ